MALGIRCLAETPVCCVRRRPVVCSYTLCSNSKTLQICLVPLLQSKPWVFGSCLFPWQRSLWVLCFAFPPALRMLWSRPPSREASPASPSQPLGKPSACPREPGQGSTPRPGILSPSPRAAVPFVRGNKARSVRCGGLARLPPPPPRSRAGPAQKPRCSSRAGAEVSGQPG